MFMHNFVYKGIELCVNVSHLQKKGHTGGATAVTIVLYSIFFSVVLAVCHLALPSVWSFYYIVLFLLSDG